ncbi:G patch domain-containing protein 1 homolog [Nasonia vitripennis]|uniref:G-patch domain-containing protein n=1 Tax=Nasonia vitripennis TaxID=7425 RepID=A0A7M7LM85_NASVI|nr:G patch domain-containing protein 1 homolog [Nasonia vitripennis]
MSDEEDDFVTYGNALDPLDEENLPRKKAVTIEEQFAYDDQGRRRFHGAFTGGFSAGYFNTVGSRDGWRPQQFKSTRANKAGGVVQRPEDFMDEEDTGQFGIAPTAIRATQEYSDETHKGKKRERAKQDSSGPIPGTPVLRELLKPVRERAGVMLLKKMGWRPGQGVGPRLTKKEKKHQRKQRENIKVYGCSLPSQQSKYSESESGSSDDEFADVTFAPDDYEPFRCNPKDNYFGIGYSGLDRRPVLGQHINLFEAPSFSVQDKNKKLSIKGQAFGVGAFEAEDDDIYARDDMSRYDFALGPERKAKSRWSKKDEPKHSCIEGFVPAKQQLSQKKVFIAPTLPKDFNPVHKVRKSRFSPLAEEQSNVRKRYEMNAESRAKIINDDRPSIIDSKKAEPKNTSVAAKLISRTLNLHGKEQSAERQKLEQSQPKKSAMSWLDKLSATTFVKGETMGLDPKIQGNLQSASAFESGQENKGQEPSEDTNLTRPSFADLDKQRRFEQFLSFSEGERKLKFSSVQPLSMTEWERDQEVEEFEKAAALCERIDKARKNADEKTEEQKKLEAKVDLESLKPQDRMTAAAKMKMYGKLTRTDEEWKPAKLVCVRFNIAEPSVGVAEDDKKKKKFSIFDSIAWNEVSKFEAGRKLEYECEPGPSTSSGISHEEESDYGIEPSSSEPRPRLTEKEKAFEESYKKVFKKVEETKKKEDDVVEAKEADPEEPVAVSSNIKEKKDLYKSIFLSSSEDEESEGEESKLVDEEKLKAALIGKSATEMNAQRNTSPPRGIFANVDFDSLMKRPDKAETPKDKVKEVDEKKVEEDEVVQVKMEEDHLPPDVYGPALPTAIPPVEEAAKPVFTGGLSRKSGDGEDGKWVEKSRDKKKSKKEKKKHKHKERSRSKSRKKSKKEKRH